MVIIDKYGMTKQFYYWRTLALNMLFAFQGLFIASSAVDFFLTVLINSNRSQIFSGLPVVASMVIAPWIIGLFISSIMLIMFIHNKDSKTNINGLHMEYGFMILLYASLFVLSLFNPLIAWPVMANYLIHLGWACSIIYFRNAVSYGRN